MNIETKTIRSGQPRPYADHFYETEFKFWIETSDGERKPMKLNLSWVRKICAAIEQAHEPEAAPNWASKVITDFKIIEDGRYVMKSTAAYTG